MKCFLAMLILLTLLVKSYKGWKKYNNLIKKLNNSKLSENDPGTLGTHFPSNYIVMINVPKQCTCVRTEV